MLETFYAVIVVFVVIAAVLAWFEVIDLFELLGAVVKLIAALLFAVGAFFVWLIKRGSRGKTS